MSNYIISYFILLLIVSVIGVVRYKKLTIPFKILSLLIILTLLLEILSVICAKKYKNNLPVSHTTVLTEYILFSLTYYFIFKNRAIRISIVTILLIFIVLFFVNAIFIQPYRSAFPSNMYTVEEIIYAIFSLMLFKQMLLYPLPVNIIKQSVFWFNTSILFYSTTMFFNFGLMNYYIKHHLNDQVIFNFIAAINMIFYLLIGISISMDNKQTSTNNG
jgi:hypothetical protein